jgi:hypothetical protein
VRLIGRIESDKDTRTFGDFLYVQGIDNEAELLGTAGRFGCIRMIKAPPARNCGSF